MNFLWRWWSTSKIDRHSITLWASFRCILVYLNSELNWHLWRSRIVVVMCNWIKLLHWPFIPNNYSICDLCELLIVVVFALFFVWRQPTFNAVSYFSHSHYKRLRCVYFYFKSLQQDKTREIYIFILILCIARAFS
jgi:hypothetical protein